MSDLYKKHNYLNKDIEYLINNEITEYDMKSAGFNLIKKYKLIPNSQINYLEGLDKKHRQIMIGIYQDRNKDLKESLNEKFVEIRKIFFETNVLRDDEVLSIKKDAIITLRKCYHTIFDNVEFVDKNVYTSYFYINKNEFYINNTKMDVKGISDEKLEMHKEYMLDFLYKIFRLLETNPNKKYIIDNLREFITFYKEKRLHIGYYRELNSDSLYKLNQTLLNEYIGLEHTKSLDNIDISYNYMHYIIPLVNILV